MWPNDPGPGDKGPNKNCIKILEGGSDYVRKQGGDSHGQVHASTQGAIPPGATPLDLDLALGWWRIPSISPFLARRRTGDLVASDPIRQTPYDQPLRAGQALPVSA
jgi:hypothetical protein